MHEPVLLNQVIEILSPKPGQSLLDCTAGYGGHAKAILALTRNYRDSVLVDRDKTAIDYLQKLFANKQLKIVQDNFLLASELLAKEKLKFDIIFADLGVSSLHLDKASRGFSFNKSGPLDMRMDQRQELTAERIVNLWEKEELVQIINNYGEEPRARKIAEIIVRNRPINTTDELANLITRTAVKWKSKHPATQTFQALRIAVNDELEMLKAVLPLWMDMLSPGGKLGIISFHSLEDRIVKHYFTEHSGDRYDANLWLPFKAPIVASKSETVSNPRSRSAKLRVAVKINKKERTSDEN